MTSVACPAFCWSVTAVMSAMQVGSATTTVAVDVSGITVPTVPVMRPTWTCPVRLVRTSSGFGDNTRRGTAR